MKTNHCGEGSYSAVVLLVIQNNGDIYSLNPVSEVVSQICN